jgi:type I restriction enzyme M protein
MAKAVREEVKPYVAGSRSPDNSTIRNWLWEAAYKIRGPVDAPKYKDYILPLIFVSGVGCIR